MSDIVYQTYYINYLAHILFLSILSNQMRCLATTKFLRFSTPSSW